MARNRLGTFYKKTPDAAKWTGAYVDPHTKKRKVVPLFTDHRASRKRLDDLIVLAEHKATGLVDRFAKQRQRLIGDHVTDYLRHCRHIGESTVHVDNKESQLGRLIVGIGASRLTDLEPNRVESYLQSLSTGARIKKGDPSTDKGHSARSVNQHRATAAAFVAWCVQNQRAPDNPLKT